MEILLIRHAEIAGDPHQHYTPPVTGCLSEIGVQQAKSLALALSTMQIDAIYASPLGRALQTAQYLAAMRDMQIQLCPWLIEWRPATVTGECDESQYEEILRRSESIRPEMAWKTPAGEGCLEMAHRIIPPLLNLLANRGINAQHGGYVLTPEAEPQNVALVAHGGSLGMIAAFLLGIPIRPFAPFVIEHVGVMRFRMIKRIDVWYPALVTPSAATLNH